MSIGPVESAILTVLFIATPIGLAVLLGRYIAGVIRSAVREILDERYARGEIGTEEYGRIRRDLAS